jgi:hypothetical protein
MDRKDTWWKGRNLIYLKKAIFTFDARWQIPAFRK